MNTNNKERLIGIILAGGKGTRLDGKGKLNHKFNNNTLLEHVYDCLLYTSPSPRDQ